MPTHFSWPSRVPQGLVRNCAACHKALGARNGSPHNRGPRARQRCAASFHACAQFPLVGIEEPLLPAADIVANHPQRLWISLWTGSRRHLQVALPKGFSFVRSIFERSVFVPADQGLTVSPPSVAIALEAALGRSPVAARGGG